MPVNPHVKGGSDVPIGDGGTGASDAATGLSNLGGLDVASHGSTNHAGIPGVGDLTVAAHSSTDHAGITGVGRVVQVAYDFVNTSSDIASNIPISGSAPTNSQGDEILSATLTPTSNSNILLIEAVVNMGKVATTGGSSVLALFKDSDSSATYAMEHFDTHGEMLPLTLRAVIASPTTVSQTWKIRAGRSSSGSGRLNGNIGSSTPFGAGNVISTLTVWEIGQ
jgi:hypothetical protein